MTMSKFFQNPQHKRSFKEALKSMKVGERLSVVDLVARMAELPGELQYQREDGDEPRLVQRLDANIGEEISERTFEMSMSSETPYLRWFGWEILGHDAEEVDMSWLASGRAPYLADHDHRTQIGVIKSAEVKDRRIVGQVLLGNSERAKAELADIRDGIRTNNSIGYEILELLLVKEEEDISTYRVTKWRPYECSLVSLPADPTVGVGRSVKAVEKIEVLEEENKMNQELQQALEQERQRIAEITRLAVRHNMRDFGDEHIGAGTSLSEFRGLMLDKIGTAPLDNPVNQIGLGEKETRQFRLSRFMLAQMTGRREDAPYEMEVVDTVSKQMRQNGLVSKGAPLPYEFMTAQIPGVRVFDGVAYVGTRALNTGTAAQGGNLVATDLLAADFITLLRNACLLSRMGARTLGGLVGNVDIPRQIAGVSPSAVAEAAAATAGSSDIFGKVSMAHHSVHGIMEATQELLRQSSLEIETFLRLDLLQGMATTRDYLGLNGTGTNNQPLGLLNTTGVGVVVGGDNGAKAAWKDIVKLETLAAAQNVTSGALGYLTNAKVRGLLKETEKFTGSGKEIWTAAMPGDDPGR